MGDGILDLAAVPHFIASEWIGIGKRYPTINTPYEVQWARDKLLKIPETEAECLPSPSLPVTQFLQLNLPPQAAEIITTKPRTWFSNDEPCTEVTVLMTRPIPPKSLLVKLEKEINQAWFDGAKSVIDTRYNSSTDRLPLWVITLWKTMGQMVEMQSSWQRSSQWLDEEEDKTRDTPTIEAISQTRESLMRLGWNIKLPYSRQTRTTIELTTFLSIKWLSDEHIDMMMEELSNEVTSDPELAKKVIIAPLAFSEKLQSIAAAKHTTYTRQNALLLVRYEKHIKDNGTDELYFPVHVRGNHWIAGLIDFKDGVICFG